MNALFRGWMTKNWTNVNEKRLRKMRTLNKIIVKHSARYYSEA